MPWCADKVVEAAWVRASFVWTIPVELSLTSTLISQPQKLWEVWMVRVCSENPSSELAPKNLSIPRVSKCFFFCHFRSSQVGSTPKSFKTKKQKWLLSNFATLSLLYNRRALGKDLYNVPLLASTLKTERSQLSHMLWVHWELKAVTRSKCSKYIEKRMPQMFPYRGTMSTERFQKLSSSSGASNPMHL